MEDNQNNIVLLTTNSPGFPPVVFHRAIKFWSSDNQPLIIHRTISGIEITDYGTFMKKRHILHEETIPLKIKFDPIEIKKNHQEKFDWLNNNCEDFTSEVIEETCGKHQRPASPQRCFWIALLAVILITIILLR